MTPDGQKLVRVGGHKTLPSLIVFTGGEPALQLDDLLIRTIKSIWGGYGIPVRTAIETNGTASLENCRRELDWITCSPKCLDGKWYPPVIHYCDELKIIIGPDDDLPKAKFTIQVGLNNEARDTRKWISPMTDPTKEGPDAFVKESLDRCIQIVKENPGWRISLQSHKILQVR